MALTIHQKSVYLIILNATMILRSVGKSLRGNKSLKDFKVRVFQEIDWLTSLLEDEKLTEDDILNSIEALSNEFRISWGQAQKPINVILKYHYYLKLKENNQMKKVLHCPIDSVILKALKMRGLSLTAIDKRKYLEIQQRIQEQISKRIEFDTRWDKQHLLSEGIIV